MERQTFKRIWDMYVVKAVRLNPLNSYIFLNESLENEVFEKYEQIKIEFKKLYFSKAESSSNDCTIDRHKRAAIMCYAFNEVSPIEVKQITKEPLLNFKLFLVNQRHAFYFGLATMLLDYKTEAVNVIESNSAGFFFDFPKPLKDLIPLSDGSFADNSYVANLCRDLYFSKEYRNFNILTMANVFYMLETYSCQLKQADLLDDMTTGD